MVARHRMSHALPADQLHKPTSTRRRPSDSPSTSNIDMKILAALFLLLGSALFAESPEVKISAQRPDYAGYKFSVLSVSDGSPETQWVTIAVSPPARTAGLQEGHVEIRTAGRLAFSAVLDACRLEDAPLSLRNRVPQGAITFTFKISLEAVETSRFFYRLPWRDDDLDPEICVLPLAEFVRAAHQAPSERASHTAFVGR